MKLFIKSNRFGSVCFTTYEGYNDIIEDEVVIKSAEETVTELMAEIGHEDIEFLSEEDFNAEIVPLEA